MALGPSLTETSDEAKRALAKVSEVSVRLKEILDPDSDFQVRVFDTMRESPQWQNPSRP